MASSSVETARGAKPGEEAKPAEGGKAPAKPSDGKAPEGGAAPAATAGGGGIKAFIPLIAAVAVMPVLAFAMTRFVLLPKLEKDLGGGAKPAAAAPAAEAAAPAEGGSKEGAPSATTSSGKNKISVNLNKILVNVAGTMGTRYLMTSLTLVGTTSDFASKIEDNKPQLMDLANGTLSAKTIADLEKPGARNVIRAELMTVFNNALGGPIVQEIYITELAIQ